LPNILSFGFDKNTLVLLLNQKICSLF